MLSRDALTTFRRRLTGSTLVVETLTPQAGLAAMVSFYRDERVDDCDVDEDGDMLLVEWGPQSGRAGSAGDFAFSVIRQFIGPEQDAEVWQLALTFLLPVAPSSIFRCAGRGAYVGEWARRARGSVDAALCSRGPARAGHSKRCKGQPGLRPAISVARGPSLTPDLARQ